MQRGFGRSSAAGEIMALLKAVEALPKSELPHMPERYRGPSPKGAVGDLVRVLLKAVSEQHGVAARIIATSDEVDALVLDDDADVPALKGWRRKLFGDKALAIKHGRIGLAATRAGRRRVPDQRAVAVAKPAGSAPSPRAMKLANSGCGSNGFDFSSGWNCTPMNHGWSVRSTISGSVPSGETPENSRPVGLQHLAVVHVHFVAVAVALGDAGRAVDVGDAAAAA